MNGLYVCYPRGRGEGQEYSRIASRDNSKAGTHAHTLTHHQDLLSFG